MNSGHVEQIALRHTGELVKEAAERNNGRFSVCCLLKGQKRKKRSLLSSELWLYVHRHPMTEEMENGCKISNKEGGGIYITEASH